MTFPRLPGGLAPADRAAGQPVMWRPVTWRPTQAGLKQLLAGVQVFTPDWADINANLEKYVDAWEQATGS